MLTVGIRAAKFTARHGVLPEEATLTGEFEVDITCRLSSAPISDQHDELARTLDYGVLLQIATAAMAQPAALLETVVARIVAELKLHAPTPLAGITVEVRKLHPPLPGRPGVAWVRWEE